MLDAQHNHSESATELPLDSDIALLTLIRQGNERAFRQLYERHLGKVYGLSLRLTGNRQSAEEATQEVFIQLWRKHGSFAGHSSFSTWLHRLATNTTISYLRRQRSWLQRMIGSEDYEQLAERLEAPAEASPDLLLQGLARLPQRARLVFVLQAIEGYRQEQIASTLGISTGTVKAQFHRARRLLEQWIDTDRETLSNDDS